MAAFPDEWWRLKRGCAVKKTSKLLKFQPYLDKKDGIIKIRARTALSETLKSSPDVPILQASLKERPDYEHFLLLIICYSHQKIMRNLEESKEVLLAVERSSSKEENSPKLCHLQPSSTEATLPPDRCSIRCPFEVTVVDFAEPFYIRGMKVKSWVCLFTCSVNRDVHLKIVLFMSVPLFCNGC